MRTRVLADADAVARTAASLTAEEARAAVAARGRFVVALSGGRTPWTMLRALADEDVPWAGVHVVQVDERVAPAGDPDRNLTHLRESLLAHCPIPPHQVHAMPVESADLAAGSTLYAELLELVAGSPPVLDLAHLGLGADGHTASLVPGDPVLDVTDASVALSESYQGPAPDDPDVPHAQSIAAHRLARHRGGEGGDAGAPSGGRSVDPRGTGREGAGAGSCRPECRGAVGRGGIDAASERGLIHDHFSAGQGVEDDHMNVICVGGRNGGPERRLGPRARPSWPPSSAKPRDTCAACAKVASLELESTRTNS